MKLQKKKKEIENNFPDWLMESLKILKPPEQLTVTQWADKYRILDAKTSAEPGTWNTSRTPYLQGIMDAFLDVDVEEITFVKPTQVGGTEALNNILGYIICQDQSPTLIVYPTIELAEYTSKNRLQPLINQSPAIVEHYRDDESKLLELQFDGMYVVLSGANSPASLASRPIRYLLLDEIDKYKMHSGKEADPISLARERTKTFVHNKKIFKTSTPTTSSGPIWQAWESADSQLKYHVPCPHCGGYQEFVFKQVKWSESAKTPDEVQQAAYYECIKCKKIITDSHKPQMLRNGKWEYEKNNGKKKIAFHLNSIYSPWVRFGEIAYEFKKSKDYPELLQNFRNSWLAEPWRDTEVNMDSNIVLERQSGYEEGVVPDGTLIITGGVDVQKDTFYYTIRAWGEGMTSWNIAHGVLDSWDDIEKVMNLPFTDKNGKVYQVNLCAIDSGHKTDDVYDFCALNLDWIVPVKGSSRPFQGKGYSSSVIDKMGSKANGLRLYLVDGNYYKDSIAGRLKRENGRGSWMVYDGCDQDYAEQICSEEKTKVKKAGQELYVWQPKTAHADNHYLDCEVYAACAADLLLVRFLKSEQAEETIKPKQANGYIKHNGNWLNKEENWLK